MVGFVSPRKRCTYSAKNARVSVQSHGADLRDKGKRPNWRRFSYSPIENGKVVAPVNACFDHRKTTGVANVVMVSSTNNANGRPPASPPYFPSWPLNIDHPVVGAEDRSPTPRTTTIGSTSRRPVVHGSSASRAT